MASRHKEAGNKLFAQGDYNAAIAEYSKASDSDVLARLNRAAAFLKLERWQEAVNDCDAVIAKDASLSKVRAAVFE